MNRDKWRINQTNIPTRTPGDWRVYQSPDPEVAVVLYQLGEIGMNKQIGRLAVVKNSAAPEVTLLPVNRKFWFESGPLGIPVVFVPNSSQAILAEYVEPSDCFDRPMGFELRILDYERVALLGVPNVLERYKSLIKFLISVLVIGLSIALARFFRL